MHTAKNKRCIPCLLIDKGKKLGTTGFIIISNLSSFVRRCFMIISIFKSFRYFYFKRKIRIPGFNNENIFLILVFSICYLTPKMKIPFYSQHRHAEFFNQVITHHNTIAVEVKCFSYTKAIILFKKIGKVASLQVLPLFCIFFCFTVSDSVNLKMRNMTDYCLCCFSL